MHADRTNRIALTLLGLLALLTGAAAVIASAGGFGATFAHRALLANRVSTYIGQHGTWLWAGAAFVCLLIFLAALRWILALLVSTDRTGDLTIPSSKTYGSTKLQPAALTGALTREIGTYHGVGAVKGRIIGDPSSPQVVITVTATPGADLAALHNRIEAEALTHARQALANPALPIELNLDVSRRS
jgi:hypothetical protein